MKLKFVTLLASIGGIVTSQAFTLDFTGLNIAADSEPVLLSDADQLVIEVADFGNVGFGVANDGETEVSDTFGVPAIEFDASQVITINFFAGIDVTNVVVDFVGVDSGEDPVFTLLSGTSGTVSLNTGTVGIEGIGFEIDDKKIPEPSTAILALLGAVALMRRHR